MIMNEVEKKKRLHMIIAKQRASIYYLKKEIEPIFENSFAVPGVNIAVN